MSAKKDRTKIRWNELSSYPVLQIVTITGIIIGLFWTCLQIHGWFFRNETKQLADAMKGLTIFLKENAIAIPPDWRLRTWDTLLSDAYQGDALSQFTLGYTYEDRFNDCKRAVEWYEKAADQRYPLAQTNLGLMYLEGRCVPKNDTAAVRLITEAANQGLPGGQYNLGLMYHQGRGVAKDDSEAARWWKKAAKEGHARAQLNLGESYRSGMGIPEDRQKAIEWFSKAAKQGNKTAIRALEHMEASSSN